MSTWMSGWPRQWGAVCMWSASKYLCCAVLYVFDGIESVSAIQRVMFVESVEIRLSCDSLVSHWHVATDSLLLRRESIQLGSTVFLRRDR